jgi:heat shock protein HslJ
MSSKMHIMALVAITCLVALAAACVPPPPAVPTSQPGGGSGSLAATSVPPLQVPVAIPTAGQPAAAMPAQAARAPGDLTGTGWTLAMLNARPPVAGTDVTLNFGAGGTVSGSDGCNAYNTTYTTDGSKIAFKQPIATTMMACPEAIMSQASAYLAALGAAARYGLDGQKLTLFDTSRMPLATFSAQSTGLAGTNWSVLYYNNGRGGAVSVIIGTSLSANFSGDGKISGNSGCNDYSADYRTDGQKIAVGPIATTRKMCPTPDGVMDQEQEYLAALNTAATYRIDGKNMEMRTTDGALAAQSVRAAMPAPGAPATPSPSATTGASTTSLQPSQIRLDTQGLPSSWQPVSVPATSYDASQPPGPTGLPQHIEILFGATKPADRQPGSPIMYIIPVDAYRQMYNAAGNTSVSKAMDRIFNYTASLPTPAPTSGMPALPYEEVTGHNDLAVQVGRASYGAASASKSGYRFVGRWAQDANPVTNQGLRYVYQGFTNDGQYLVSFFYPVTTKRLPRTVADVPADQMAQFNADPMAAIASDAQKLNGLDPADWDPDLRRLDALVGSLQIIGMTPAGLLDQPWTWAGVESSGGLKPLVDPSRTYQVFFHPDGTLTFKADCNSGSGTFTFHGGATGSLQTSLGPSTLAECNDGGQGQAFVSGLAVAQSYQVRPGGSSLDLVLPAGGGTLVLSNQAQ